MLKRTIEKTIDEYLSGDNYKILFIWGPRRSGKTTLLNKLARELKVDKFNFDLESDKEKFLPRREITEKIVKDNKIILIDEVQNYPEVTRVLKILHDEYKIKIIATGSSELKQKTGRDFDTLAGRTIEAFCLPLSVIEIEENAGIKEVDKAEFQSLLAEQIQIFGAYPEVYSKTDLSDGEKVGLLQDILDIYVLKDVVEIYDLKNAKLAKDILTKIALQLGSEVSIREIALSLGANVLTVSNYIEIFIKNYILIPLLSFKTNTRKAVSEKRKLYFYDLGIRNALVKDFRETKLRPDQGGLFENFIISEIEKQRKNTGAQRNLYFYREYGGKEVDLVIEDYYKKYQCVEVKVQGQRGNRDIFPIPHSFVTIDQNNYFPVITHIMD